MPENRKGLVLSMMDLTLAEFEKLYYVNEKVFRSANNWFYFANDKKVSSLASKGYVCYGRNRARMKSFGFPQDGHGAAVLLCFSEADMNYLRERCADERKGVVQFDLNDGTEAHYAVLKDPVGAFGPESAEYPLVIVPNNPQTKIWPYSTKGFTTYEKASAEEGTLPYHVETGAVERLLPDNVKKDLGI